MKKLEKDNPKYDKSIIVLGWFLFGAIVLDSLIVLTRIILLIFYHERI